MTIYAIAGSPYKKSDAEERQVEVKKVRIGPGGATVVTDQQRNIKNDPVGSVIQNNILLVDMNSEGATSAESVDDNASASPPESPVDSGNLIKNIVESKIEEQIEPSATKLLKRYTRDVRIFHQFI